MGLASANKGITSAIKLMTEAARIPISENTLRKILKQINDITN
jgi:Asp-tRNA(Asn)/Glu-tRNA(Gln) amidotransferase C subunit